MYNFEAEKSGKKQVNVTKKFATFFFVFKKKNSILKE